MKHISQRIQAKILQASKCWMAGLMCLFSNGVFSEITLDGSLGPKEPLPGPNFEIKASMGRQAGGNLFHSFETFNIHQGESATFSGPNSVANILSRVTGGSSSTINGLLSSTIPGADFYLINPAGVLFGPHASLDVQGSFHVGSADYIGFPDGLTFDAHDLQPPVTLSVASPEAFGFLGGNPAGISLQGTNLRVLPGEVISLVGGDVEVSASKVSTLDGGVNFVSLDSPGKILSFNSNYKIESQNEFVKPSFGDINFTLGTQINVGGSGGNGVYIKGGEFVLDQGSAILGGTLSTGIEGNSITIDVEKLKIKAGSQVSNGTFSDANGGSVTIKAAGEILISGADFLGNISAITSNTFFGQGKAGDISIKTPLLRMEEGGIIGGGIGSEILSGFGIAPNININVGNLIMNNKHSGLLTMISSQSNSLSFGGSNIISGNINLIASEAISISGFRSGIRNNNVSGDIDAGVILISTPKLSLTSRATIEGSSISFGNASDIILDVRNLLISNGAVINSSSGIDTGTQGFIGFGEGGNIHIKNAEVVTLSNGIPFRCAICSTTLGFGDAGSIVLETSQLKIDNSAISTSTFSSGQAGLININADKEIAISGSGGILATTSSIDNVLQGFNAGDAGKIILKTPQLKMLGNAQISSSTIGDGDGSEIVLDAANVSLSGGAGIFSASGEIGDRFFFGRGNGGLISIKSNNIFLDNSSISTSTLGPGDAGKIEIFAKNAELGNQAKIFSRSVGLGDAGEIEVTGLNEFRSVSSGINTEASQSDGGNITIKAKDLISLKDSSITASVKKGGNGGNIDIDPQFVILDNSQIIAQAEDGSGGNINLTADFLFASPNSIIDASSDRGINGQVNIDAPDTDILGGLEGLPANFLDAASILSKPCAARTDLNHIRMAIRDYAYEVLPQSPDVLQVHLPSLSSQTEFDHRQNVALKSSESAVMQLSALSDCHESM